MYKIDRCVYVYVYVYVCLYEYRVHTFGTVDDAWAMDFSFASLIHSLSCSLSHQKAFSL